MTPLLTLSKIDRFTTYPLSPYHQWRNPFSKKAQNFPSLLLIPPVIDYIAAIKHICNSLGEDTPTIKTECGEFYTKVKNLLTNYSNKSKLPKSKITKRESEALCSLKKDSDCLVLTADKGVALVVIRDDKIR